MVQEVGTKIFDGPHDSEEFFFPHRVVSFSGVECTRDESDRMVTMIVFLCQDSTKGIITCISSQNGLTRRIEDCETVGRGDSVFEIVDSSGMFVSLLEFHIFACEFM